jgi:hypothetical protein
LTTTKDFEEQTATAAQKSFSQDFDSSYSYPGQVYDKWIKSGIEKSLTTTPLASMIAAPISTANQQIESKATDYFSSNIAKIVMAKNDSDFNSIKVSMIAAVKAMGLEAAEAEKSKNYETAKTMAKTFN